MIRWVIGALILLIFVSLFKALFHLVKQGGSDSRSTVNALTWRVGLTAALFLLLLIAGTLGWIEPHGL